MPWNLLHDISREVNPRPVDSLHHSRSSAKARVCTHQAEGADDAADAILQNPETAAGLAAHDIGKGQERAEVVAHVAIDDGDAIETVGALPTEVTRVSDVVLVVVC